MMADRVIVVFTVILAIGYLYATSLIPSLEIGDPLGPKAFPRLLGIGLLIAAGLLALEMWKDRKENAAAAAAEAATPRDYRLYWVLGGVTVWTALYYVLLQKLGYVVDSSLYLFGLMSWFNRGRWVVNAITAVTYSLASYFLFAQLDVRLPSGILPF